MTAKLVLDGVVLPDLYCPFPPAVNPARDAAQIHTEGWAAHHGLIQGELARRRFRAARYGWLAARAYPYVALAELEIVTDWNVWLFMLDDQCDESGAGRQPERLRPILDRFLAVLADPGAVVPDGPLSTSLAELWERMRGAAAPGWDTRFVASAADYFDACLWEAANRAAGRVPSVADYVHYRPATGGLLTDVDLIEVAEHLFLPDEVRLRPDVQALVSMCNNVVCWSNDIISLPKETRRGDVHNLVLALKAAHDLSLQEAVDAAAAMHDREAARFLEVEAALPSFGKEVDAALSRYVGVLRSWMRGNLDWSFESGRYYPSKVLQLSIEGEAGPRYLEAILGG